MKYKIQIPMSALAALSVLATITTVQANQAYNDPTGGWDYLYDGSSANAAAGSGGTAYDSLDGNWNHSSATGPGDSDHWDGSTIGGTLNNTVNHPGGVEGGTDGSTTYLRIQDPGNTAQSPYPTDPNNNGIAFGRDLTGVGTLSQQSLADGITLYFRIRVPTSTAGNPLDNTWPGDVAYPAGGQGYGMFGNGIGPIAISTGTRTGTSVGCIGFGLAKANDTVWPVNSVDALYMNNNIADSINNHIDTQEGYDDTAVAVNYLPVADANAWNDFWVTIQANDDTPGNGTHTVSIYANGSLTPVVFDVTAGNNQSDYGGILSMQMALARGGYNGAMDVDFYAVKDGLWTPQAVPEPTTMTLAGLGLLLLVARLRRRF